MSPIFPIDLGATSGSSCPDRRVPGFDDTGLCGARLAKVDFHRTAHPGHRDCREMLFTSCPAVTHIDECLCNDGVTTEPGVHIGVDDVGGYIGFGDPLGEGLTAIALKTAPGGGILGAAGAYWYLFGATDTTNLNCPIDEDDWDQLLINGAVNQMDLPSGILEYDVDGNCIAGAITIPLGDLNLVDVDGLPCVQTGGRRAFAIGVYDANGARLMFCPVPGILPLARCDKIPCCNWILGNVSSSEDGTTATIDVTISRPSNCTCTPATVTVTIDGTPYVVDPSLLTALVEHIITPYTPGQVVLIELDQTYGTCDAPECIARHEETSVTL